jgi:GTPase SAR1 family protein
MVIGADGVGKSWLVNRLVRYIETGCDDTLKELNEDQQTFRENRGPDHPMIEMPYPESITLDHKVITTET